MDRHVLVLVVVPQLPQLSVQVEKELQSDHTPPAGQGIGVVVVLELDSGTGGLFSSESLGISFIIGSVEV
jgi:hypothetical protein